MRKPTLSEQELIYLFEELGFAPPLAKSEESELFLIKDMTQNNRSFYISLLIYKRFCCMGFESDGNRVSVVFEFINESYNQLIDQIVENFDVLKTSGNGSFDAFPLKEKDSLSKTIVLWRKDEIMFLIENDKLIKCNEVEYNDILVRLRSNKLIT